MSGKREKGTALVQLCKRTGEVHEATCSCPAGKSGYCNHVMTLPYEIAEYSLQLCTNAKVGDTFIHGIVNVTTLGKISLAKSSEDRLTKNRKISSWATVSRNKFHNFQSSRNFRGKSHKREKRLERNLLGKLIIALRSNRNIDQEYVTGNYELSEFPPSLMCCREVYQCKDKSSAGK